MEVIQAMKNASAIILAGGEGKRMKSNRPKVLSEVMFQPMLKWVIDAVKAAGIEDICVVTGSKTKNGTTDSLTNKISR